MYFTYILYSSKIKKFYTGQTLDIDRRLVEHNRGKTPFMASGSTWKIVYTKIFSNRSDATKLEKYIKKEGLPDSLQIIIFALASASRRA